MRVILVCVCQLLIWMIFSQRIAWTGEFGLELAPGRDLAIMLVGVLGVGLLSLAWPGSLDRVSRSASWILFVTIVIPSWVTIYAIGMEGVLVGYITCVILPVVLLGVWARSASQVQQSPFNDRPARLLAAAFVGLLVAKFIFTPWSFPTSLALESVYERRLAFRELGGSISSYLQATSEHAIAPLCIAIGLASGRRFWLVIAVAATVGAYLSNGSKQALFLPIAMVAVFLVGKRFKYLAEFLLAILAIALSVAWLARSPALDLYLVRRAFCAPPQIVTGYLFWFDANGPLYGRDIGFLSMAIYGTTPETPASLVIGAEIMHKPEMNANTNCFAYGFAELGLIGPWVVLAGVGAYLKLLESVCKSVPSGFSALLGLQIAVVLSEQSLHTAVFSGGLAATLACCWILAGRLAGPPSWIRASSKSWTSTRLVGTTRDSLQPSRPPRMPRG